MRRIAILLTTACMIAAGLSGTAPALGAAVSGGTPAGHITWGRCADPSLQQAHAKCGFLSVPLDYANPSGPTIKLAVSRIVHTSPASDYQGVMLVNPGGPGGSGLGLVTLGQFVPNHAGDDYDWIGFDPRGVGSSQPALSCLPYYFHGDRPAYVPNSDALIATWLTRSRTYARACEANAAALLPHMRTADSAMDMDSIRRALGVATINYYGFSYGTYLGEVYATMFPTHVRRMVFDSTIDPHRVFYQSNLDQDVAFERNIKIWFGWLAKYHAAYHLGQTEGAVERLFYAEENAMRANPVGGIVGPDEWTDIFLYAGYYQFFWTYLAGVFAGWVHNNDTAGLIGAYKSLDAPGFDNGFAVYLAVQCTDAPWPLSWNTWQTDNWRVFKQARFETWGNAWFNGPCLYWGAAAGAPVDVQGGSTKVLMIDETLDAATPYPGSLVVRGLFPDASLIAEPGGTTHAGTLFGDACVDNKIAAFLATGAMPPRQPGDHADAYCKPLPQPVPPTEASASITGRMAIAVAALNPRMRP